MTPDFKIFQDDSWSWLLFRNRENLGVEFTLMYVG